MYGWCKFKKTVHICILYNIDVSVYKSNLYINNTQQTHKQARTHKPTTTNTTPIQNIPHHKNNQYIWTNSETIPIKTTTTTTTQDPTTSLTHLLYLSPRWPKKKRTRSITTKTLDNRIYTHDTPTRLAHAHTYTHT